MKPKSRLLQTSSKSLLFLLSFVLLSLVGDRMSAGLQDRTIPFRLNRTAWAAETSEPDIQWFKQEMRIAEKYREHREGIWGMSWAHFITMVFLIVFFIAAVIAMYIRNKRTREMLASLLKEK